MTLDQRFDVGDGGEGEVGDSGAPEVEDRGAGGAAERAADGALVEEADLALGRVDIDIDQFGGRAAISTTASGCRPIISRLW